MFGKGRDRADGAKGANVVSFSNGNVEFTYATEKLRFVIDQAGEGRQLGIWAALQNFLRAMRAEWRTEEATDVDALAEAVGCAPDLASARIAVNAFVERRRRQAQAAAPVGAERQSLPANSGRTGGV